MGTMLKKVLARYQSMPVQIKASFWFLVSAFLQKGIQVISTPVFTRLLTTAEYGQYNIFNSWLGILTVCVSLNLSAGVYARGLVKFKSDRAVFSSSLQGLSLLLVVLWSIVYFAFLTFWNDLFSLTTAQMSFMFLIIWSTAAFGFWSRDQREDFKYRNLVIATIVMALAKPLLGIVLVVLADDKVTAWIFSLAVVEVVVCAIPFWSQIHEGKKFFSAKYWKHALMFNIPLIPHYLSTTVLNSADRIMIGKMVDEASAGIYGLAYSISLVMTMFNTALLQTIEPWLYRKIHERRIADIAKVAYPAFIVIAALNLFLIALAPEAVAIFAPAEYYDAIWVIPPVAMSVFFMFSYSFFAVFEFYYEKTKLVATATCMGALLNVFLNYFFIRIFGYYAAGYTTLFCYIVYAAFHFIFMRMVCKQYLDNAQPYSAKLYVCIAGTFIAAGFIFLASYSYWILRYALLGVSLIMAAIFHKKISNYAKQVIRLKNMDDQREDRGCE